MKKQLRKAMICTVAMMLIAVLTLTGVTDAVVDKTIVVAIKDKAKHPLYKKTINKTKKLKAHDEKNECGVGDTVRVVETRHLSKDKCWRMVEIIEKAK